MIKMMKRNRRSLVFLLVLAVAAIGLFGVLSFAAPAAGQANNNKTRTKAPQRDGTSPSKRAGGTASLECKRQCRADYKDCVSGKGSGSGPIGVGNSWKCYAYDACIHDCEYPDSPFQKDKPAKRIKARPRTPRPPTP